jgi:hypothetical protein
MAVHRRVEIRFCGSYDPRPSSSVHAGRTATDKRDEWRNARNAEYGTKHRHGKLNAP